jgi:arginyl-tRNA synthetase
MNNTIGESINRFARFSGAEVETISYPSDVSLGIGKAVWAFMDGGVEKLNEFKTEEEKLNYLGNCYVVGTKAMEENPSLEPRIREITKIIYEHIDSPEYEAYKIGKEINLSYFKNITKSLGSNFDDFIYESEAGKEGEKLVRENTGKIFEESEGAVVYKGEQDGLHTRVFINKEGYPTYEAKDVGLLSLKFSRYNPDLSIFVTDHEQSEYFKVVVTAAGKINSTWKEKTIHRTHGRMSFKGQKMSSRLGGVPIASTLIQAVAEEVKEKSPESSEEIQNMIAISALKFTILKSMAGKNINFDPDTSLSFEGDSGPYLQYSTVRSGSVLEKGHVSMEDCNQPETITDVEKYLDRFPEVAEQCISLWEPHHMVGYLLDLAQAFNSWYGRVKIIDAENKDMPYNLAITRAFQITMKNGLYLLGIETPEKM